MFEWFKRRRRDHALTTHALPDADWAATLAALPLMARYPAATLTRLRELTTLFLVEKSIVSGATEGEHRLEVTPAMRILIAVQACLLIVGRGGSVSEAMNDFEGWENVVVFPGDFPRTFDYEDEAGVVHRMTDNVAGESWEGGPVLLSWPSVTASYEDSGMALVIHEFAHKIDEVNGGVDGVPLLHGEALHAFAQAMRAAYADFCARVERGEKTWIDPYAAEHPEEFFAVSCEVFFAEPDLLAAEYEAYYERLRAYFNFDPVRGEILRKHAAIA